ncbi:hypothetical protein SRHO_G00079810 [Serrasalmus rhombeus]
MTVDHHILSSLDWKHGFQCIVPPGFEALDSSDSYISSRNCGLQGLDQIRECLQSIEDNISPMPLCHSRRWFLGSRPASLWSGNSTGFTTHYEHG